MTNGGLFSYSVQALLVQTGDPYSFPDSSALKFLTRIQSNNIGLNFPRQDVFDWAGGGDQVMVQRPSVTQDFSYCARNGTNERNLGFNVDGTTPALLSLGSERNYYGVNNLDHQDELVYSGQNVVVLALGNGVVTNYSVNCAVGQTPIVSVSVEGLNALIQTGTSGQVLPAIYKQNASGSVVTYTIPSISDSIDPNDPNSANTFAVIQPKDLFVQFDTGSAIGVAMSGANAVPIQSFSLGVSLPRIPLKQMGWAYPESRPLQWPITVTMQADAYVTDYQLAAINQNYCPDSGYGVNVLMKQPCSEQLALGLYIRGAKLQSQSFTSQIGQYSKVSFNWTTKIYDLMRSGANDPNFYIEAFGGNIYFLYDYSVLMTGYDVLSSPFTYQQDYYRKVAE